MAKRRLVAAAFLLGGMSATTFAGPTVVRFGRLVDGRGNVLAPATVVIEGDRIADVVQEGAPAPEGADVIDLSRYTGLPGLIDVHTHMTYGPRPGSRRHPAVNMVLGQEALRRSLEAGVTTARDMNATEYLDVAMRDLVEMGAMVGPRLVVVGYGLRVTRTPFRPGSGERGGGVADGPAEVMRAVREQIAAGADWIKMFGSTGSGQDLSGDQTFTFEEMKAAVDAAHALGARIAIHSYGPAGARDAVRAGADSLEHAVDIDDDTLAEMARRGTFYVPTIDHNRYYAEHADELGYAPDARARLEAFVERNVETVRRAVKAGVRIAMGSDAIYTMFGENTRELRWFVKAGMTPADALATATSNAAALLGREDELGAVAPGYFADLVAVEGDPVADIDVVVEGVRWVMKAGRVVVGGTETSRPGGGALLGAGAR